MRHGDTEARRLFYGIAYAQLDLGLLVGRSQLRGRHCARDRRRRSPNAAQNGDRESVRALLKKGLDVNEAQGDGSTALHWAAIKGDAEMARMLIYAGANVRATTRIGAYTPLYLAAKGGYSDVVAALLGGRRGCEGGDVERHDAADDRGRGRRHAIDHVARSRTAPTSTPRTARRARRR